MVIKTQKRVFNIGKATKGIGKRVLNRLKRYFLYWSFFLFGIPILLVLALRWVDPVTSAVMVWHDIESFFYTDSEPSQYQWTDWDEISIQYFLAVVASEDQRFPTHFGLDFAELKLALSDKSGKPRGASTITQQVAKNLFLWNGRSYVRKGLEVGFALLMELFLSKQRILEIYVNIAQLGENIYGIGIASVVFFDKPPGAINRYEAARMAAVLPNPVVFSVEKPSHYVLSRQKWIQRQMEQLGGPGYLDQL